MKKKLKHAFTATLLCFALSMVIYSCSKSEEQSNNVQLKEATVSLLPQDHTVIMEEVFKNMQQLKKSKLISKGSSGQDILKQLLTLPNVSSATKAKIKQVITINDMLKKQKISAEVQAVLKEVQTKTSIKNVSNIKEFKKLILSIKDDPKYQKYPEIINGLDVAYQIVLNGENNIYSSSYYKMIPGLTIKDDSQLIVMSKNIAEEDKDGAISGAVAGAIAGSAAGGVGAGPGAVTGGITGAAVGSAAAAISNAIDWVLSW